MNHYDKNPHRVRQMKNSQEVEHVEDQQPVRPLRVLNHEDLRNTMEMSQGTTIGSKKRMGMGHRRFGRGRAIKNPHKRSTVDASKSFEDIHKLNEKALRLLAKQ